MSHVLDQSEIDALLSAVEPAAAAPDPANQPVGNIAQRHDANHSREATYNFRSPERVSKDQIRAIASIHEAFARNFGATLSGFVRTIMDVRVIGVEQLSYSEFIQSLPNPTCFSVLQAPPLEGQMCLELSPVIVYPILDRLLGGTNGAAYIPPRSLTHIEWRLIERLTERAIEHLSEAWKNLVEARFELVENESNPHLVHIVAPSEVVLIIMFEIKFGQTAGTMSLCIPYNTIESVLTQLAHQSWFFKPKAATPANQARLLRNLSRTTVGLRALLGRTTITMNDLRRLQKGDQLLLDKRATREIILQIDARNKFAGSPGNYRGRRAIRLTRLAESDEPL